jgi:phage regulator Rha-like protein
MAISAISATTQRLSDITTKMIDRFDELTKRIEALEGNE